MLDGVDDETLALARRYAGSDFDQRRKKRVNEWYAFPDEEWELNDFLRQIAEAVPPEYRDTAHVQLTDNRGIMALRVVYRREETQEEVDLRVARALDHAREIRAEEREEYERLRAKYEGPN